MAYSPSLSVTLTSDIGPPKGMSETDKAAEAAKGKGIETVVFDRGGFAFGNNLKTLADSAREAGLKF